MTDTAPLGQPPVAGRDKKFYAGHRDGKRPLKGDPLKGARDRYDVVVIGSGLGGLTAANILARAGRSVCVIEQHYNYGGLATWFKRKGGHVFDISLHGFPFGMKKTSASTGARRSLPASSSSTACASTTPSSASTPSSPVTASRTSS